MRNISGAITQGAGCQVMFTAKQYSLTLLYTLWIYPFFKSYYIPRLQIFIGTFFKGNTSPAARSGDALWLGGTCGRAVVSVVR